jgi:hypothetical protein
MKDKKSTIILITAVGLVWGFALFQLISSFFGKNEPVVKKAEYSDQSTLNLDDDSFELELNYRDPFLGKVFTERIVTPHKVAINGPVSKVVKPEPEIKKVVDLSFIKYIGLIKNQKSGKQVSLLAIHGKDYFMLEGQTEKEITLLKNMIDSVQIKYQNSNYYIKK